jgi:hypothetical protein
VSGVSVAVDTTGLATVSMPQPGKSTDPPF